jgi:hypothetical protein
LHDAAGPLDAVEHRHVQVHQHDVRLQRRSKLDRLFSVAGTADDLEALIQLERQGQCLDEQFVVVRKQDSDTSGLPSWVLVRRHGGSPGKTPLVLVTCALAKDHSFEALSSSKRLRSFSSIA